MIGKDLLYSAGRAPQYSAVTYMGRESKKEWMYMYNWFTSLEAEYNTTLHIIHAPIQINLKNKQKAS